MGRGPEEETRAALEDALTACEDWLYEEGTYGITDATVFDDKLAEIKGLMEAGTETPDGEDGEDSSPDDVS